MLTALALLAVLLVGLFGVTTRGTVAFFAVLLMVGAWEWSGFAAWPDRAMRTGYCLVIALICALAWRFPALLPWRAVCYAAVGWWLVAALWIIAVPGLPARRIAPLAGVLVLVPTFLSLSRILTGAGRGYVFLLLLLIWAADIGAYFAGRAFGRHPLAPLVSPKKTWEGALGGFVASFAVAAVAIYALPLPPAAFVLLTAGTVAVSIVGDLTESLFKRGAGLKDSGSILPGHGGVLDRIDSLTAAAPLFALGLDALGIGR